MHCRGRGSKGFLRNKEEASGKSGGCVWDSVELVWKGVEEQG